jgi:tetratricopeptide (TPR) repeat protein
VLCKLPAPTVAEKLLARGYDARRAQNSDEARRIFSEALALCRKDNLPELPLALAGLAQIERDLGNTAAALNYYSEAATIHRAHDALALAHTLRHIADIHRESAQPQLAAPLYAEALAIYRANADTPSLDLANCLRGCALLEQDLGHNERARDLWSEAGGLYSSVNVEAGVKEAERRMAQLAGS